MILKNKPERVKDVSAKIGECLAEGKYYVTKHAFSRQRERMIRLPETLYVLETGHEDKKKTSFDAEHKTWKYAICGKTLRDELDVRVIIAFDESGMLIITVMYIERF